MANADIELRYPPGEVAKAIAVRSFGIIQDAWRHVTTEIGRPVEGKVVVIGAADLDEYKLMTRKEWWYYAWIKGDTIYAEPVNVMMKRLDPVTGKTIADMGFTQRLAQMALDGLSAGRMPVWMKEGVASHLADEWAVLRVQIHQFNKELPGFAPSVDELEDHIMAGSDMKMSRLSYFYVFRMVENLIEERGLDSIKRFARRLGEGASLDEASRAEFGMDYEEMVTAIKPKDITDGMGPLPQPREEESHDHHGHEH